jgi:hypothetical protein
LHLHPLRDGFHEVSHLRIRVSERILGFIHNTRALGLEGDAGHLDLGGYRHAYEFEKSFLIRRNAARHGTRAGFDPIRLGCQYRPFPMDDPADRGRDSFAVLDRWATRAFKGAPPWSSLTLAIA